VGWGRTVFTELSKKLFTLIKLETQAAGSRQEGRQAGDWYVIHDVMFLSLLRFMF